MTNSANRHVYRPALAGTFCAIALMWHAARATAQGTPPNLPQPQPPAAAEGELIEGEVLTRGPIHEAFAVAISHDPQQGAIAPKAPPPEIEELPPEQKPEGDGFVWISGYWWWDEELENFIWVSGVWRRPPPGHVWIPGYWRQVSNGFQRTPGYWAPSAQAKVDAQSHVAEAAEVQYLPPPPPSVEAGPNSPQPSVEYFWVPGHWDWYGEHYVWRAGYWAPGFEGWVWIPAHYLWTPCGYVYVPGYWDYSLAHRGLGFCPVYFDTVVYVRPRVCFRPRVVIQTVALHTHLFFRPRCHHYYFGDYYAPRYVQLGFHPWFALHHSRIGYDPLYTYHYWYFARRDPSWPDRVESWYHWHVSHESARPPHTLAAMQKWADGLPNAAGSPLLAVRLDRLGLEQDRRGGKPPIRIEPVGASYKEQLTELRLRFGELAHHRAQLEQRVHDSVGPEAGPATPRKVEVPIGNVQRVMRQLADANPGLTGRFPPGALSGSGEAAKSGWRLIPAPPDLPRPGVATAVGPQSPGDEQTTTPQGQPPDRIKSKTPRLQLFGGQRSDSAQRFEVPRRLTEQSQVLGGDQPAAPQSQPPDRIESKTPRLQLFGGQRSDTPQQPKVLRREARQLPSDFGSGISQPPEAGHRSIPKIFEAPRRSAPSVSEGPRRSMPSDSDAQRPRVPSMSETLRSMTSQSPNRSAAASRSIGQWRASKSDDREGRRGR